jgi:proteasome alpha subunit
MYPSVQAYDRGVMFSPDGRLFQVEYAKEAVRKGTTAVGITTDESVVFVGNKSIANALVVPSTIQKIFRVDANLGATYSGIVSDGLHLINSMRSKSQTHRMIYNEAMSVDSITREAAEEMQMATQYGGIRPYAVSLLIGGIDDKPMLYEVDPTASPAGYKAYAIGSGKKVAEEILLKDYKDGMSTDAAIKLGINIIKKVNESKPSAETIDVSKITRDIGYEMLKPDEITKYL